MLRYFFQLRALSVVNSRSSKGQESRHLLKFCKRYKVTRALAAVDPADRADFADFVSPSLLRKQNKLKVGHSFLLRGAVCVQMEQGQRKRRYQANSRPRHNGCHAKATDSLAKTHKCLISANHREDTTFSGTKTVSPEVYPWMKELRSKGI